MLGLVDFLVTEGGGRAEINSDQARADGRVLLVQKRRGVGVSAAWKEV